jgi:hypothetical protein
MMRLFLLSLSLLAVFPSFGKDTHPEDPGSTPKPMKRCGRKKAKNGIILHRNSLTINMRDFREMPFCARI